MSSEPTPKRDASNLSDSASAEDLGSNPSANLEIEHRSPERKVLNLQPTKSRRSTPGLIPRPIDPSPVQVSHTVSIAGTRPVMADPRQVPNFLHQAPKILNRPIAPNETEDNNRLLEYLD
ncbi:MAG: hypothetical protein ACO31I_12000 [Prochlorotrichaceae cyanobacterium]|jgi:hypothetical protein